MVVVELNKSSVENEGEMTVERQQTEYPRTRPLFDDSASRPAARVASLPPPRAATSVEGGQYRPRHAMHSLPSERPSHTVEFIDSERALAFADLLGGIGRRTVAVAPALLLLSILVPWMQGSVAGFDFGFALVSWGIVRVLVALCVLTAVAAAAWLYRQRSAPAAIFTWFVGAMAALVVAAGHSFTEIADRTGGVTGRVGLRVYADLGPGAYLQAVGSLMLLTAGSLVLMERLVMFLCYRPPLARNRQQLVLLDERAT